MTSQIAYAIAQQRVAELKAEGERARLAKVLAHTSRSGERSRIGRSIAAIVAVRRQRRGRGRSAPTAAR